VPLSAGWAQGGEHGSSVCADGHGGGGQGWVSEQQDAESHGGGGHDGDDWLTGVVDDAAGAGCGSAHGGGHDPPPEESGQGGGHDPPP
jgi:hypothetical protein